uniref:F-box domain-containing protein n=1 Tax=Mycena chlorophos TaxID=658473 RepID=A0ABQ0KXL8_MYCCL|nr:predicted protein [Mycena chlorophos]
MDELPTELLGLILGHASSPTLHAAALLCRRLAAIAQPLIFRKISLCTVRTRGAIPTGTYEQFWAILKDSPRLGALVQEISLTLPASRAATPSHQTCFAEIMRAIPSVHSAELVSASPLSWPHIPKPISGAIITFITERRLRRLTLTRLLDLPRSTLTSAASSVTNLRLLFCSIAPTASPRVQDAPLLLTSLSVARTSSFNSFVAAHPAVLRSVRRLSVLLSSPDESFGLLRIIPGLEEVDILLNPTLSPTIFVAPALDVPPLLALRRLVIQTSHVQVPGRLVLELMQYFRKISPSLQHLGVHWRPPSSELSSLNSASLAMLSSLDTLTPQTLDIALVGNWSSLPSTASSDIRQKLDEVCRSVFPHLWSDSRLIAELLDQQ